jgi:hypothetical protein
MTLFAVFRVGLIRDLQDRIGTANWGRMLFGLGAAITELDHGGYGYTIANVVENRLILGGLTDNADILAKLGTQFPDNLHNSKLINTAIDTAVHVKWDFNPAKDIRGAGDDDIGFVDYVRISFYLFGHNLLSLYLTYFVILGVSVWAFIGAFGSRPGILGLLIVSSIAQGYLFTSILLDHLGSITDPRFLSTLGIIPTLHIASIILNRCPPSLINVTCAVVQSIILVFAFSIRATVLWAIFAIVVLTVGLALEEIRTKRTVLLRIWSFGILAVVAALQMLYVSQVLHPVYGEKGEIAHHAFWHAVFYQLQNNPNWQQKFSSYYDNATGDLLPQVAAHKYLAQHPPPDPHAVYLTPDHKYIKASARELYTRKAFIDFFVNDPKFVFETVLIYNTKVIGEVLWEFLTSLARISMVYHIASIVTGLIVAMIFATCGIERRCFINGAFLVTGIFLASLLPNFVTVQGLGVMADPCFLLLIMLGSWALVALSEGISAAGRLIGGQLVKLTP